MLRSPKTLFPNIGWVMISIVVPAYATTQADIVHFERLLASIEEQSYSDFEVLVSDHSPGDVLLQVCNRTRLPITYVSNSRGRGNSSINMNEGISRANGDVIKIMHMDDWFVNKSCLELIASELGRVSTAFWGVLAFDHQRESRQVPERLTVPSLRGTLGCPSVSFFRRDETSPVLFDENLIIINDHDMHQSLLLRYGTPIVITELCVRIGVHANQVSNRVKQSRLREEIQYFCSKRSLIVANMSLPFADRQVRPRF